MFMNHLLSPRLVPDRIWSQDRPISFVVMPLCFREDQEGFVVFDVSCYAEKINFGLNTRTADGRRTNAPIKQAKIEKVRSQPKE
jgi:hypothetical protein